MTVGKEEEQLTIRQNEVLATRGIPTFQRLNTTIGAGITLWTQNTTNITDFITGMYVMKLCIVLYILA